jgi:hypothetical protein
VKATINISTMKRNLIFVTGALLAGTAIAAPEAISTTVVHHRTIVPVSDAVRTEGALQRGVRVGNPMQMINPRAPGEYGDGREFITPRYQDAGLRPRDASRSFPIGLRLFSIPF